MTTTEPVTQSLRQWMLHKIAIMPISLAARKTAVLEIQAVYLQAVDDDPSLKEAFEHFPYLSHPNISDHARLNYWARQFTKWHESLPAEYADRLDAARVIV